MHHRSRGGIGARVVIASTLENKRVQGMPDAGRTHGPPAEKNAGGRYHRFSRHNRHSPRDGLPIYTRSPWGPAFLPPSPCMIR